ncbi:hypothetical protein GO986_08970 [Deinococcus sp. HMF7620]|uniref:Uncharacterized protein n=1 Tax=Deinococcus arboris TaxID=2682977 RepID=A0A7C9HZC3_9DEIO|nr:hypothetical protein [Deinococcus arboris]MVN86895.1 hypothetical protein [Deinococcus arboris]
MSPFTFTVPGDPTNTNHSANFVAQNGFLDVEIGGYIYQFSQEYGDYVLRLPHQAPYNAVQTLSTLNNNVKPPSGKIVIQVSTTTVTDSATALAVKVLVVP